MNLETTKILYEFWRNHEELLFIQHDHHLLLWRNVIFNDDIEDIKHYLSTKEGLSNIDCFQGRWVNPLGHWCSENRSDIVDLLIASGANINIQSIPYEYTPLHFACGDGFVNIINSLLIAGADTNICNYEGKTPMMCEVENNKYIR